MLGESGVNFESFLKTIQNLCFMQIKKFFAEVHWKVLDSDEKIKKYFIVGTLKAIFFHVLLAI